MKTAKILADIGHNILLLKILNIPNIKNPDADIDGVSFEFKHNHKPTKSAIDNELRKAFKQADNIVLHILSDISSNELCRAIVGRLKQTENANMLWIITKNNELIKISTEQSTKFDVLYQLLK